MSTVAPVNLVTAQVVDAAIKVHSTLGPGLLESAYQACLAHELRKRGLLVEEQVPLPIVYDGIRVAVAYRIDMVVNASVLLELKAVAKTLPVHDAQLLSNLRLSGYKVGLLLNFHVPYLKDGIKRMVNNL